MYTNIRHSSRSTCRRYVIVWVCRIIAALLPVISAAAQESTPRFTHLTVESGLSQSFVYAIFQDSRGLMWFGTRDGLNKFDGYSFTCYKHEPFQPNTISSSVIRSITEDRSGALWIGTFRGGINRFDRRSGRFISFGHDPTDNRSLADDNVNAILVDSHGTLWIATRESGLDRLDNAVSVTPESVSADRHVTFIHYRHDPADPLSISSNRILAIHEDRRGVLWVGTARGLSYFDRSTGRFSQIGPRRSVRTPADIRDEVMGISEDSTGGIWAAEFRLIFRIDPATGVTFRKTIVAGSSIAVDRRGMVLYGSFYGLSIRDPRTGAERLFHKDSPRRSQIGSNNVITLFSDRVGAIWVGTDNGVDRIDPSPPRFSLYDRESGVVNDNNIRSIADAGDGRVWIGTAGAGLTLYDRRSGEIRRFRHAPAYNAGTNVVNTMFRDHRGTLWLGTRFELMIFDSTAWRTHAFLRPGPLAAHMFNIWSICEDRDGALWIGATSGLYRIDAARTGIRRIEIPAPSVQGDTYEAVWSVRQDRLGQIWICTPGGVASIDRKTLRFTWYRHDPTSRTSLSHTEAFVMFEDRRGTIWIGTWGGGLDRFDRTTGQFRHYTTSDGLASNVIHGILEDDAGALWISTGGGISKFTPSTGACINFDKGDGLQGVEFNPNACCRMEDGAMFFGGLNGLNSFYPERITIDTSGAPIAITSFKKFDALAATELFDGESAELLPQENYCSFEFAALVYANADRVHYAYKLEGFDNDWNYSGTRRYAAYTNLDPGEYIFRVKATNGDGVWNERGIAIHLHVIPPFWKTWAFRAIVVLGLIAGAFVWYRMREGKRRSLELALEEARENERREIAAELHDGPLQDLYSTRFMLEPLSRSLDAGPTLATITTIDDTLRRVRGSLRNVCGDLQLPYLDSGLDAAIEAHVEHYRKALPETEIVLDLMRDDGILPDVARQNLFRIYRSALNNIAKHARATRVVIRLAWDRRQLLLEVIDNGHGFKPPASLTDLMRNKHYGLLLADAHARALGGRLEVTSIPNAGTTVRVKLER